MHSLVPATWLSGVRPDKSADRREHGDDARSGGRAADRPRDTTLPSLEVASETTTHRRRVPSGAGCYYSTTLSFRNAIRRCRWSTIRARCSRSCSARATRPRSATAIAARRKSLLDLHHRPHARAAEAISAPSDRAVLDDYLETVREIERRVAEGVERATLGHHVPEAPDRRADAFDEQVELMFDLDRARVSGGPDARRVVHHGGRRHEPHLQPHRRVGRVPSALAPRERQGADQEAREDPDVAHGAVRRRS